MEQAQDMIRVGVVPSMIGAEGDAPIVVSVPRNTSPDQFEAVALAEARKVSQPQRGTLAVTNPMNRDQSVGFNLPPVAGEWRRLRSAMNAVAPLNLFGFF